MHLIAKAGCYEGAGIPQMTSAATRNETIPSTVNGVTIRSTSRSKVAANSVVIRFLENPLQA